MDILFKIIDSNSLHQSTQQEKKMVLLKNTVIIPSTELISFLIDISRVVDFQTYNKINSISDRLVKDD